jgi:hypothetical protein
MRARAGVCAAGTIRKITVISNPQFFLFLLFIFLTSLENRYLLYVPATNIPLLSRFSPNTWPTISNNSKENPSKKLKNYNTILYEICQIKTMQKW